MSTVSTAGLLPCEQSGPRATTAPYVLGTQPFTGGSGGKWTVKGIEQVTCFRDPFGLSDASAIGAELMVVVCPEVTFKELVTDEFMGAWKQFAREHCLELTVNVMSTQYKIYPHHEVRGEPDRPLANTYLCNLGLNRDLSGGKANVWFVTQDFFDLMGSDKYYAYVLGELLHLRYGERWIETQSGDPLSVGELFTPEEVSQLLQRFATDPEGLFGRYDNLWHNPASKSGPFNFVTVIRSNLDGESHFVTGRIFEVESSTERWWRHQDERS